MLPGGDIDKEVRCHEMGKLSRHVQKLNDVFEEICASDLIGAPAPISRWCNGMDPSHSRGPLVGGGGRAEVLDRVICKYFFSVRNARRMAVKLYADLAWFANVNV